MARRRTIDLLPEIFRTDTNRKFLSATLDQLIQEPQIKRTQGYVGRRVGPGVNPADNYVAEIDTTRADYQLEPGVVFLKPNTNQAEDAITYPGYIDSLDLLGADTTRQDRLFQSEYYTWDPFCDIDKFTNYSQYYWLPQGVDSVDVGVTAVPLTDDFAVTRSSDAYQFTGKGGNNPILTLIRGGNYRFDVNQVGHQFWIQTAPGVSGRLPATPNISSRDVLGVSNNGDEQGVITFDVPQKTAQEFYYTMLENPAVDLISTFKLNELNNVFVDDFLAANPTGIDGITSLDGKTVVFINRIQAASVGGWQITSRFDPLRRIAPPNLPDSEDGLVGSYDTTLFDQVTDITSQDERYSVWQIQYIFTDPNRPFMQLTNIREVAKLTKFRILFGDQFSSTQWYRDSNGFFDQIPLLSALQDTLYYQDGTNPEIFGEIRLIDSNVTQTISLDDIIGARTYTSPNGIVFTNGLKVQFRGLIEPALFQNEEYYVEGVGTGPGVSARVGFVDGEAYFGLYHFFQGRKMTGPAHDDNVFQQFIYDTVAESLANPGSGAPVGAPLPRADVSGAPEGNGIKLIPVRELVTPELYTESLVVPFDASSYDVSPYDAVVNAPLVQDYITINRASKDRNAWSRSNRWFHIDVIRYAAEKNNQPPTLDERSRGKRPIIEFRANLGLFNNGTQSKGAIDVIDLETTDAFSQINGQAGYSVDGVEFVTGTRVIFAADIDSTVRNRIYRVDFINPDGDPNSAQIINLVAEPNGEALTNQTVVSLFGVTRQGKSFWFDGANWVLAQEKTSVNQAPLFDLYDQQGRSFGDRSVYPSSTFLGNRLFGYALGTTEITDSVLGIPLKFLNINNVGDIVFENDFYTGSFEYVDNRSGVSVPTSSGFVRQYIDRVSFSSLIGWQPAAAENRSRQIFRFIYDGSPLVFDIPPATDTVFPPLQIFLQGIYLDPNTYTVQTVGLNTIVTFSKEPPLGAIIEAQIISDVASSVAFYQVPLNLENNPLNGNSSEFTLGTIRTHYDTIGQNLRNIVGPINGANNSRDLGNILRFGQNIVQHSAPLTLTGVFLRRAQFEINNALIFNSQEYTKYKAIMLDLASKGDYVNLTPTQILDAVTLEISLGRTENSPFYWSDMLPTGETFVENTYTYGPVSTPTFDTVLSYNFDEANYRGLLIFLNGFLLTWGQDYTIENNVPSVTITAPLQTGDVIVIREYSTTYGSFVPNTPTKLGLYPAYIPAMYLDTTAVNPTMVIRGHDGSITVAYGDARDLVLLEFETRIYNNLKVRNNPVPLTAAEVIPGQFRTTDYSLREINQILSTDFLSWVGWNKLDYITQTYESGQPFTYNYSQSSNRLDAQPVLGAWRGIYNFFYDTTAPNSRPWEMLGFSQEPAWWQSTYGPAPYTSGNLVLWDDLENGLVNEPNRPYVLPQYRRPGLSRVIPAGSEGELLNPLSAVIGNYDAASFDRSWSFGDDGPVENAWRTSSAYPFALMRLLAVTKPAKFFSLFVDRDRYRFDSNINQYLWDQRYRLDAKNLAPLYGDGVSKASYINWIVDYNQQLGVNSTQILEEDLDNIDLRLCWRLGAFSDKRYLKIFTERSSPTSQNEGLLLPDESYQLLLYSNPAFDQNSYSSVIVQTVEDGWAVQGYSTTQPFFNILASRPNGNTILISAGGSEVRVAAETSNNVAQVPYGFVFTSRAAVCDFLISYGRLLTRQGWLFENRENGYVLDWPQMAQEFLYWSNQGWGINSMINLNPAANRISVTKPLAVAESLLPLRPDNIVLNQNRQAISPAELVIDRLDNTIRLTSLTSNTINYVNFRFTSFEHLIILDNRSIFADLIYDPNTGARQSRILVSGALSADWNGTLDAPGFILNQDNIQQWLPNRKYAKGEIVLFKDEYWVASTIINPSEEFNYVLWIRSDFDEIQRGLLPNAANSSDLLASAYSTYNANLEREVDLFSYGLIGFRPREYMQALNLDDVSQVNLYQQFLGTKGTRRSAEIFSLADLGKEIAEYNIYEYWAIASGTYGANANHSWFDLLLNQAELTSDPSLVQIILPQQASEADQTVLISNIWSSSFPVTSPNILPTLPAPITDRALPSAGYVNLNDVDYTAFDLFDAASLNDELDDIGVGTTIWVARSNAYDWNVYRVQRVAGDIIAVSDNLDGTSQVTFTRDHGLIPGQILLIRFFADEIDGSYRVVSVPTLASVNIVYSLTGNATEILGEGVGFRLTESRVASANRIAALPFVNDLLPGARVWVDNDGQDRWTVLEKTQPFEPQPRLISNVRVNGARFGASVSQGFFNQTALVGAPGYNPDSLATAPGAVYPFIRNDQDEYEQNVILTLNATDAAGYGSSMDIGDQSWAIVGAPQSRNSQGYVNILLRLAASNQIDQTQLLVAPDLDFNAIEFGHAVTMSQDERWCYIGAPGGNKVYAFARVDVQPQSITYVTNGLLNAYRYDQAIKITQPEQMSVTLNNVLLVFNQDYTLASGNVVLNFTPPAGQNLIFSRKNAALLDQQLYPAVNQDSTSGVGSGATFAVYRVRGVYSNTLLTPGENYQVGDTLTINAASIGGGTSPANDLVITVDDVDINGGITAFSPEQVTAGITNTSVFALAPILATATNIWSFSVIVNGQLYRPELDYDFNADSALDFLDLVFTTVPPAGATISVQANTYFRYVSTIMDPEFDSTITGNRFGHSVSATSDGRMLIVGAPGSNSQDGKTYVFGRGVQKFIIDNVSNTTLTTANNLVEPVIVTLNGAFLANTALNVNGGFTVLGPNQIDITIPLTVGDVVEIETNGFQTVQTIQAYLASDKQQFGYVVDQCLNDCSLYLSAPFDSSVRIENGHVEYWQNQARWYGSITTEIANPTLTVGNYISVNDVLVQCTGTTVADLVEDIRSVNVPNVAVSTTPDLEFVADGTTRTFDVGNIYSVASSFTPRVFKDDVLQTLGADYTYNATTQQIVFSAVPDAGSDILVVSGRIQFTVKNFDAAPPLNRLQILPGTGTMWADLGITAYVWQQIITAPVAQDQANFGKSIFIADDTTTLLVGAPGGSLIRPCTFDNGTTVFDARSTLFADPLTQSGAVYSYNLLPGASININDASQFVFGQQVFDNNVASLDQFGSAIDYTTGTLLIGAPGSPTATSSNVFGQTIQLVNQNNVPAWSVIRLQRPAVDVARLNTIFMYDRISNNPTQYFDYFDPLQGKLLGVVRQNIDYIGAVDPAQYNVGTVNNNGQKWAKSHVGQIWWNTSLVRFIDPNQNDIVYASRRWGSVFPGSRIEIYQWIASTVPPAQYTGPGTPLSQDSYVIVTSLDVSGVFTEIYYFWVTGIRSVDRSAGKTLSIDTLAQYIESPRSSGISYVAALDPSTIAIYNGTSYISAQDTVLHVEFDRIANNDAVHRQYQLVAQDRADGFLSDTLYRKWLDSFCGADTVGNPVPDPLLPPAEKFGPLFRPRQSMFANRFLALQNYLQAANAVVKQFPISETRSFNLLNSSDPEPSAASGQWDFRVANLTELSYQDLQEVDIGYRYLVQSDSANNGLWTIYEVVDSVVPGQRSLLLIKVQNYDTRFYWNRIDWYQPGFDPATRVSQEVINVASLDTLTLPIGSVAKVSSNSQGFWELYQLQALGWTRVGLQSGTIEFSPALWNYSVGQLGFDGEVFDAQYFDQAPLIETRRVLQAINQEILTGELLLERNRLLILSFNFILSEQLAPTWLAKTSLIDVDHVIRNLEPFQIYRQDNQDFVLQYINEVKPYHTQIREFNLIYQGRDQYQGTATDFDLPAFFDTAEQMFISPVLDNTGTLSTTSSVPSTSPIWQTLPWNQWFQNYLLNIELVTVVEPGTGYVTPPTVTAVGQALRSAVLIARINSAGELTAIDIVDPGEGYAASPVIVLEGGNGTGAVAVAVMGNNKVRSIDTIIRYDRYQYESTVLTWQPNTVYQQGQLVRFDDRVWQAISQTSLPSFDPSDFNLIPPSQLSGVDRTMGYYVPFVNEAGLDLAQLITGVDYPGVQVSGLSFDSDTGFDVGNYDMLPFDNISFGPEGRPTYDPALLDTIYASNFLDPFLGVGAGAIDVSGGEFVDTYSSHAPEELVPGAIFDTLDMRVFTTPGADWIGRGHGFPTDAKRFLFDPVNRVVGFSDLMENPVAVRLFNITTGSLMTLGLNYSIDWPAYDITINNGNGVSPGDVMSLETFALGGGNQLFTESYLGDGTLESLVVPRSLQDIYQVVIFVNGSQVTDFSLTALSNYATLVTLGSVYSDADRITLTALGYGHTGTDYSWSLPITQNVVSTGSLNITLSNSLQGTNRANTVVTRNGRRARPPEGKRYIADGSTVLFDLPSDGGYNQSLIADNDVSVYVNNVSLTLGTQFFVTPSDGSSIRSVILTEPPDAGAAVLISVRTAAQYWIVGNQLSFRPSAGLSPQPGDLISITTWNDTSEQTIETLVFVGPTTQTVITAVEGYDDTLYDEATLSDTPGSFDYSVGSNIQVNRFDLDREITSPQRLIVSLDGKFLFSDQDYVLEGNTVVILGPTLAANSVVVVTVLAQYVVPGTIAFRIFQDMRGLQSTYRITQDTTTELRSPLTASADIIELVDASRVSAANLPFGFFGSITIDGERINYRNRDLVNNTVSGLRRGVAGTGAASHRVDTPVYDITVGELLPIEYQNRMVFDNFLADGSQDVFVASSIVLDSLDSTELIEAVMVYVGGVLQTGNYSINSTDPVTIQFNQAPTAGYQVSVRVQQAQSWYQPGPDSASDGQPLQETDTLAARFIRGL